MVVEIGWAGRRVEHYGGGKAEGGWFEYGYLNVVLNVNQRTIDLSFILINNKMLFEKVKLLFKKVLTNY